MPKFNKPVSKGKVEAMSQAAGSKIKKIEGKAKKEGVQRKAKKLFEKEDKMSLYIFKVLKKIHPSLGIAKTSMVTLNSLFLDIYRKISKHAAELSRRGGGKTLSARDIQAAVKLSIPGELALHAVY